MRKLLLLLLLTNVCFAGDVTSPDNSNDIKQIQIDSVNMGGKHIKPKMISTSQLNLYSGSKLYWDGGDDTYIHEVSANALEFYSGGSPILTMMKDDNFNVKTMNILIASGKKLYLDGGGDTYIWEPAANYLSLYCAGTEVAHGDSDRQWYVFGNCSALSFTDRTPYPKDKQEAYDSVLSMGLKADKSGVDHDKLSPFVKTMSTKKVIKKDNEGKHIMDIDGKPEFEEVEEVGRNLSATVSAQNEVIKDLIKRIEKLEK